MTVLARGSLPCFRRVINNLSIFSLDIGLLPQEDLEAARVESISEFITN